MYNILVELNLSLRYIDDDQYISQNRRMIMLTNEMKEIMEVLLANRLFLYSLMHKVFGREPDQELLEILTGEATCEAYGLLSEAEDDTMARAVKFLTELREDIKNPAFLDRAKNEYTVLFIGPAKLVAPPWESVYRNKQEMLFQESTLAVREFYRKFHMLPEGYPRIPDDSLALEIHFMAKLAEKSLDALQNDRLDYLKYYLSGQNIFLANHLLVWIPMFVERMAKATSDYLYPQMCLILDDFLKKDKTLVAELMETLQEA